MSLHSVGDIKNIELNPSQQEFLTCWKRFLAFMGGVGNGKTTIGVIKCIEICMRFPNSRGVIARKSWPSLESTTMEEFFTLCPPDLLDPKGTRRSAGSPQAKFKNGSVVLFRHLDDKGSSTAGKSSTVYQRLSNLNLNFAFIDQVEEVPEQWLNLFRTRLRRVVHDDQGRQCPHQLMLTGNMAGRNWIFRKFKKDPQENYHLIEASTLENEKNLPAEYVADLLSAPKAWVERYVYGSWDDYEGLIFGQFKKHMHEIEPFELPPSWPKFRIIDHGITNPGAAIFVAVDNDGNCFIFRDYYKANLIIRQHVRNLMSMSFPYGSFRRTWYDPSVFYRTKSDEKRGHYRVYDEYISQTRAYINERPECKRVGLWGYPANNDFKAGVDRVNEYAYFDENHTNPMTGKLGSPRVFVFKGCEDWWNEQGDYCWLPPKGGIDTTEGGMVPEVEDPSKANHLMDDTRYFFLTRPKIRVLDLQQHARQHTDAWSERWDKEPVKKNWKTA